MAKEMYFKIMNDYIDLVVPLTSQGKFRCKTRENFQKYGKGFAPKTTIITKDAYLEWQIGYDAIQGNTDKITKLTHLSFVGANGKKKNPYELSEITFNLCKMGIISKSEIAEWIEEIHNMNEFLHESFEIDTTVENNLKINNQDFFKSIISLPTFNKLNNNSKVLVEITIQKQQYATGVMPMLYVIIPMEEFINSKAIIGHTSSETKYGILRINNKNKEIIKNIFLCFGMCSSSHHHDIIEILKLIYNNAFN